ELLRQGVVRPVGEGVAVEQEELGGLRRGVVEVEVLGLRGHARTVLPRAPRPAVDCPRNCGDPDGDAMITPSASYSLTMRVSVPPTPGSFARVASAVGEAGGMLGAIDLVRQSRGLSVRDVTVNAADSLHGQRIVDAVRAIPGVTVDSVS